MNGGWRVRAALAADRPAWDAFLASRPEADLLQAWAWGEAAAVTDEVPHRIVVEEQGVLRGAAQVLVRPAGFGRSVAYVPHGPVWDRSAPDANELFGTLLEALRGLAADERALVVKIDPRADPADATDVRGLATNAGLRPGLDLQARTTRLIDLADGGPRLEASWEPDARNLARRAAREGTTVTISDTADPEQVAILHELITRSAGRGTFRVRPLAFLLRLATELGESGAWQVGIGRVDGTPVAAAALPRLGQRAYYLYGGTRRDPAYRHHYAAHAVCAEMLRALAAGGCLTVDMWGVAEPDDPAANPGWRGFSHFKRAFGGRPLRHPGLFDLVVSPFWYRVREARAGLVRGRGMPAA